MSKAPQHLRIGTDHTTGAYVNRRGKWAVLMDDANAAVDRAYAEGQKAVTNGNKRDGDSTSTAPTVEAINGFVINWNAIQRHDEDGRYASDEEAHAALKRLIESHSKLISACRLLVNAVEQWNAGALNPFGDAFDQGCVAIAYATEKESGNAHTPTGS